MVGVGYGMIFVTVAYVTEKVEERFHLDAMWGKGAFLLLASHLHPLGFDWFIPELMLSQSYFGVEKWQFGVILLTLILVQLTRRAYWILGLLFALDFSTTPHTPPSDTTQLVTTYIPIDEKWEPRTLMPTYSQIIKEIQNAIAQKKKIVIFPESILPHFLNLDSMMLSQFKHLSHDITIIIGALKELNATPYNSTYLFDKGHLTIADKVILVPFGERNPLPEWMSDIVNELFFDGAVDYVPSDTITDLSIDSVRYRSAICYEATSRRFYTDSPTHLIAISNNGWFTPSTQPTLQRLLIQYYSRLYGTTVYHSVNMSRSYIVKDGRVYWR